ncbi:hypothetical protein BC938DRAFT_473555 [Jimgerdemannia flammicorona]|uniref:LYC1 C-terminal domain-containing protein n=1 Tax=Jimgerdemannia flammicorona TaxID=994334 RepID=A0A433Q469_9FUNG|nr:hypothetical protein BC938DRAFT_473555 [Jimgerdemannia flammicorona]
MVADMILAKATEQQLYQTYRNHYKEWERSVILTGQLLTLEEYLKREDILRSESFSVKNYTVWVLVPSDDPETLDLCAHCETYGHTALVSTRPGLIEEKKMEAVASVFVPAEKRGNGFAKKMMELLYQHLERSELSDLSTLYSNIGAEFYRKRGWAPFKSLEVQYDVVQGDLSGANEDGDIQLLHDADIDFLAERDTELLRLELGHCNKPSIVIVPHADKFRWIIRRGDYYISVLGHSRTDVVGARVKDTDNFVILYHDFVDKVTTCIRFRSDNVEATRKLVKAAKRQAAMYGLGAVLVWDPKAGVHGEEVMVIETHHSIPLLAWFGQKDDVEWLANEKYAWV